MPWGNKGRLIFLLIAAGPTLYVGMLIGMAGLPHLPMPHVVGIPEWQPSPAAVIVGMLATVWFLDSLATIARDLYAIPGDVRAWRAKRERQRRWEAMQSRRREAGRLSPWPEAVVDLAP